MTFLDLAKSLPSRIRTNYQNRRTRAYLDSLPDNIRKDIGWYGAPDDLEVRSRLRS